MESPAPPNAPNFPRKTFDQIGCKDLPGRSKRPDAFASTSRLSRCEKRVDSAMTTDIADGSCVYVIAPRQRPGACHWEPKQASTDIASLNHSDTSPAFNRHEAFTEAAEKCRAKFLWLAKRVTHRPEEAEDIVQTALLKAFANLSQFRGESQMSTWLTAIVHNTALEYTRRLYGKVFVSLDSPPCPNSDGDTLDLPGPFLNPEECFERLERVKILSAAVEKLSSLHRETLQLCFFDELPHVQVATALNVRASTIKSRVLRSKRALKVALMNSSGMDK
jgi:RNA polymerase sigma factor (sigma-70 family)